MGRGARRNDNVLPLLAIWLSRGAERPKLQGIVGVEAAD
jgi:hypothetical protein